MTIIADLTPCRYIRELSHPKLLAVGWLGVDDDHAVGDVDPAVVDQLRALEKLEESMGLWLGYMFCGVHGCELCHGAVGGKELFVPGDDVVYMAPQMIVHYIVAHRYQPPPAFCAAVLAHRPSIARAHAEALRAICPTFPVYTRIGRPGWPWHARLWRWLRR